MQRNRSQMLAFHLLVADLARKTSGMGRLGGGTHMSKFYYSCAEGESKREPKSVSMVGEREKEKGMGIRKDEGKGREKRLEGKIIK